ALILSLVALGFNLIFNATRVFHLAHGAMYASAVYSAFGFRALMRDFAPEGVATAIAIALSLLLISVLVVIVECVIYRPLYMEGVNPTISMISSLGVYLLLVNLIAIFFGSESVSLSGGYTILTSNDYF